MSIDRKPRRGGNQRVEDLAVLPATASADPELPTDDRDTATLDPSLSTVEVAGTDVDPLDEDPFADDLNEQLRRRAPRGMPGRTTVYLAGTVLVVAGFLGGVVVQKNYGTAASSTSNGAANVGGFARNGGGGTGGTGGTGATGGAGGGAGATAGRGVTTGTVKFVDGTTVYLTTADGETVTVKTSGTTAVRTEQTTAVGDLAVGSTVSVQGTTDANGVVTATTVTAQK